MIPRELIMGNGAISSPDGGVLMRELREEYDKYAELGYGDLVIMDKLSVRYTSFMATHKPSEAAPTAAPVAKEPAKAESDGVKSAGGKGKGGKKGGSRRRSFEPSAVKDVPKTMMESASAPVLPEGGADAAVAVVAECVVAADDDKQAKAKEGEGPGTTDDHWDSVSQMPYCRYCKMAFKSEGLLQRHIKYSELHKKTMATLDDEARGSEASSSFTLGDAQGAAPNQSQKSPMKTSTQVEGKDYKLLYFGSKFFWRSQDNIDMSFFHHVLCDAIEIIPFDVYKNRGLDRVYLDMPLMLELVAGSTVKPSSEEKRSSSKFSKPSISQDTDEATRKALTTAILARLHLHDKVPASAGPTAEPNRLIKYLPAATDPKDKNPLLEKPPGALIPITVTHRRNTSAEEVKAKMHDLAKDQAALQDATSKAEKVVNVITDFAKGIAAQSKALAAMSKPRRRWVMAIRRVLQMNGVVKTTLILEALAKKEATKSPGSKRRARAKALV